MLEPQRQRHPRHVGDDVVEAERDEGERGHPDGEHLGRDLARRHGHEDGEAHEPVGADGTQHNLVPQRLDHFPRRKAEHRGAVRRVLEDAGLAEHEGDKAERARQVADEADGPDAHERQRADAPVQQRDGHEHDVGREEVGAAEHDHDEADGEEEGADGADQAGGVLLLPRGRLGGQGDGAGTRLSDGGIGMGRRAGGALPAEA